MKKTILKIMAWAAIALIIPVLGNSFIDGWNWEWNDFIFAWVFWVIMAIAIVYVSRRFSKNQTLVGVLVFLAFASLWVMLATG